MGGHVEAVVGAGGEDVRGQQVGGVALAAEDDAALGPRRVGGGRVAVPADEEHLGARLGGAERGGQAGHAGAQDEDLAAFTIGKAHWHIPLEVES